MCRRITKVRSGRAAGTHALGREHGMKIQFGRRSLALIGLIALAALTPAPVAAAGQTVTVWWNQGFYPAEDQAMRDVVAAWEKETGNKLDLTFYNGSDLPEKIISAITTGE